MAVRVETVKPEPIASGNTKIAKQMIETKRLGRCGLLITSDAGGCVCRAS